MLSTLFWKDRDEIWEDQGGLGVWYRQGKGEEDQTTVVKEETGACVFELALKN